MDHLVALVGFSIVSSVTPGPNNLLLWASGAEFGFRATVRHVLGTAGGIGVMALAVAAGLGAVVAAVPQVAFAMKVGGSLYLLYLAWQIAGARALARGPLARPLGLRQAAAFQVINPKAWIFALGAMTTFRPDGMTALSSKFAVAVTMIVVIVPTAAFWAAGGDLLGRLLTGERSRRVVSLALAGLLVATIAYVWI